MKMAKKVLSVVLAVLMALSCFAVAASAWGDIGNAEHNVKVKLNLAKGEVGTVWTKNGSKVTLSEIDDLELDFEEDTNIYAKPGETVWVYETVESDYYVWAYENQIFYSGALIDACALFKSQTGKTSMSTSQQALVHQFNPDNDVYAGFVEGGTTINSPWSAMTAKVQSQEVPKGWPTDDNGIITEGFGKEDNTPDTSAWHWERHQVCITPDSEYGSIFDGETWLYRFPLTIPSDAKTGTVYTVTIPEGMIKRNAKKTSTMYCAEMGDEGEVYTETILTPAFEYPTSEDSGEQSWDLSEATVTITVGTKPSGVDYTALNTAIKAYDDKKAEDYTTESWAAATTAYNAAKNALTATAQADVDTATKALNDALGALVEATKLDFTALDTALAKLPDEFEGYTTSSVDAVLDAADAARAAYNATTQDEINAAAAALEEALEGLTAKANMAVLEEALAAAENVPDIADWYELSVDALEDAVAAGQAIIAQADEYTDQAAVDAAAAAINEILANHTYGVADYSALWALNELIAQLDEANYTTSSWTALETARDAVVPGLLQSKQEQVNEMIAAVEAAFNGLKEKADTSRLERAIADVDAADEAEYAADVWANIQDMVATANTYVGADLAADDVQGDIDALTDDINAALLNKLADADYSAVETAIANMPDDFSIYTDETVENLIAAYNAVVRGLKEDQQAAVDKMAADINAAVEALEKKGADYEYVDKYVEQAAALNRELYTEASLAALDSALAAVVRGLDITHQDEVTGMANDIYAALDALELVGADYTAVEEAKAKIPADLTIYTDDSVTALNAALGAVVEGKTVDEQAAVNKMAEDIEAAILGLEEKAADYTAINAILAVAPASNTTKTYKTKLDTEAFAYYYYTPDSWAAFEAAKNAVVEGKKISQQADVNTMAANLEAAYNALVPGTGAEYVAAQEAKDTFLGEDAYTAESWNNYVEAKTAFLALEVRDWSAFGKALTGTYVPAYHALTPKPVVVPADYTAFSATIIEAAKINKDMTPYTSASADAFYAAFNNAQLVPGNLTSDDQAIIDDATNALIAAINGLKYKADLTGLNDALAAAYDKEADEDLYTEESWGVLVAAVADGEAFTNSEVELTKEDNQKAIDDAAAAILAAIEALEEKTVVLPADYDYLDEAIADAEAIIEAGQGNYTDDTWNDFVNAVTAGKLLSRDLTIDDQIAVDDATSAIIDAKTALEEKPVVGPADFTALEAAVARLDGLDLDPYTEESVMAVGEAYNEARIILRDKDIITADYQADVDAAAKALNDAIDNLKLKPTEPEEPAAGIAKGVDFDASKADGWKNDYEIQLEGRPMMVQFYEVTTGNTNSYDRYNSKVTIVSYDKDGQVVDSDNIRKIAYEVWTINGATVGFDTIKVRAKANGSSTWESKDADLLTFVNEAPKLDAALKGDLSAATSGKPGNFAITGTVGKDAIMVQAKMADGSTNTISNFTVNEDGTKSFSVNGWANLGDNTVTVRVKASDGTWTNVGTVDYTATKNGVIDVR